MATSQRILVVEDDDLIRDSLVEFLEDHGYEATGAEHGRAALDKLRGDAAAPCVILVDLMMPVMDGREFRAQQLADPALAQIPVVIISAFRNVGEVAEELSSVAHLKKPLKLQELLQIVQTHCCRNAGGSPEEV